MKVSTVERITYTRKEIAEALGIGLNAVDRLVKDNAFPSWKEGGDVQGTRLARVEDIKAYAARRAAEAAGDDTSGERQLSVVPDSRSVSA